MKIKLFILFMILFMLGMFNVSAQTVAEQFHCNGTFYTVKFSDADIPRSPSWNPERDENPPLSARKAVEVARQTLEQCMSEPAKWNLESVKIERLLGISKWLYHVVFECPPARCPNERSGFFRIYVKLDGTAFTPKPGSLPTEKLDTSDTPIRLN